MRRGFVCAALIAVGAICSAEATFIDFTVDQWIQQFPAPTTPPADAPWGPGGYPGDTIDLQTYHGSLDLTPGNYVLPINSILWTIDYTYGGTATDPNAWSDLSFDFTAIRNISFDGGPSGSLSQTGNLQATWDNDYISLNDGPIVSFIIDGYQVNITPLAVDTIPGTNFDGPAPWVQPGSSGYGQQLPEVYANFEVVALQPVPEPASMTVLGIGACVVALVGRWRKHLS